MDDLVAWFRAQLDEDEAVARAATCGPWEVGPTFGAHDSRVYVKPEGPGIDTIGKCVIAGQVANMPEFRANAQHIARWDPARVLAEVDAKRRIIDRWRPADGDPHPGVPCENWPGQGAEFRDPYDSCVHHLNAPPRTPDEVVRILALPYASRPGYRDEWKP